MNKSINEQELQTQIDNLSREIQPERDLWAGIEHAIEHKSQQSATNSSVSGKTKYSHYAWAASVVAAVLLTWNLNSPMLEPTSQLAAVDVIQQQYTEQKNTMLVSFGKPDLSKLPEKMQTQFSELQAARTSLLEALKDDPDNANLLNLLQWTQSQELSLLEQLYSPKWQTI